MILTGTALKEKSTVRKQY